MNWLKMIIANESVKTAAKTLGSDVNAAVGK